MIKSFSDKETEKIFQGKFSKNFLPDIRKRALRKLWMIDLAKNVNEIRDPPSNRLEQLKKDRIGQYSIRINKQWRICFYWIENNAYQVEITDYH